MYVRTQAKERIMFVKTIDFLTLFEREKKCTGKIVPIFFFQYFPSWILLLAVMRAEKKSLSKKNGQ